MDNEKNDGLLHNVSDVSVLVPTVAKKILIKRANNKDTDYNIDEEFASQNDTDAYSI